MSEKNEKWNCDECDGKCSIITSKEPNEFFGKCRWDHWVLEKQISYWKDPNHDPPEFNEEYWILDIG